MYVNPFVSVLRAWPLLPLFVDRVHLYPAEFQLAHCKQEPLIACYAIKCQNARAAGGTFIMAIESCALYLAACRAVLKYRAQIQNPSMPASS